MLKINPFTPNSPAHTGMFVGRIFEISTFDKALIQTKNSNPSHLLLLGERGIGKTSLLNVAQMFANGKWSWSDQKHDFLTVRLSLNENICLADFAINLKGAIEREINKVNPALDLFKKAWSFLSRFEAAGVAYRREESSTNNTQLVQNLIYSLVDTVKFLRDPKLTVKKEGLVILIDESDKASKDLHLGSFLKNLSEHLISEEQNNILFILTGLPNVRDVLMQSHESSLRLFQELNLNPLSKTETAEVIQKGLDEAKKLSDQKILIDQSAQELIHVYSEGYPHYVQQIGYSVFEADTDNHINDDDVKKSFFMQHGALEQIGVRYYIKPFYKDISVDSQREILTIMSEKWNNWVTREEIKKKFSGKADTLDNGIRALIEKGIIIPREGSRGQYRLQWASFAFWISSQNKNVQRS